MYSSKISALKQKLASEDSEERQSVYSLLTGSLHNWEDVFSKAPFDCIAALSPYLHNPSDPRILSILLPWIAAGRTEGVKKTPVALVGSTISLLVHHIKIGGRTAPAPQKDESMESEFFNHKVDLTKVVQLGSCLHPGATAASEVPHQPTAILTIAAASTQTGNSALKTDPTYLWRIIRPENSD